MGWLVAAVLCGGAVGFIDLQMIRAATGLQTVWVAAHKIPVDQKIKAEDLQQVQKPKSAVPEDVIKDPKEVVGKYAKVTVLPGQVVEKAVVDDQADNLRALVRRYGEDDVAVTLQVDSQDLSLTQVKPGDMVALIGTFAPAPQQVKTRLIQEAVPVIAVVPEEKKIMLAVSRESALELARDKALGKISVALDPKAYEPGHVTPEMSLDTQGPPTAPTRSASPSQPTPQKQQPAQQRQNFGE